MQFYLSIYMRISYIIKRTTINENREKKIEYKQHKLTYKNNIFAIFFCKLNCDVQKKKKKENQIVK